MAEREGFEPSMEFLTPYSLSRGAPSTNSAISPLREGSKDTRCRQTRKEKWRLILAVLGGSARLVDHAGFLFFLDALVDFFAMNRNFLGRIHANPDLIAFNAKDGDLNVVADVQGLANASC